MKIASLFNNLRALQFYQLFRFGILFSIGIAFAKSGLSTEQIGLYEKFIFLSGAISFFWIHGLSQSLLSFNNIISIKSPIKNPILFHVFILSLAFSLFTIFLLIIFESSVSQFFISTPSIPYLKHFVLFFLFSTPTFVVEYFYLLLHKPKHLVLYGLITFLIQFLVIVIPVYLGYSFEYSIIGLIGISIIRFIWTISIIIKHSQIKWDNTFCRLFLKHSFPLILGSLIAGSLPYIDGIYVSHYFDNATFAVYMYGARELPLTILLANSLSNAIIPEFTTKEIIPFVLEKIKRQSLQLIHILFPITITLLLFSNYLYPLIFNEHFTESASIFNVLLLLIISRLVFPQSLLVALKYNRELLIASIIEFSLKIILSFILIHYMGILGIALATVFAFTFEKIWLSFRVWKILKIKPANYIPLGWILIYSVILILVFLQTEFHIIK